MENTNLPERLIELRKAKGLNRKQAAEEMGVPYGTLTNYESGDRVPRQEQLLIMARYYGITVDELLGVKNDEDDDDDVDYVAVAQFLKEIGIISDDRVITQKDISFLQSIETTMRLWFG